MCVCVCGKKFFILLLICCSIQFKIVSYTIKEEKGQENNNNNINKTKTKFKGKKWMNNNYKLLLNLFFLFRKSFKSARSHKLKKY